MMAGFHMVGDKSRVSYGGGGGGGIRAGFHTVCGGISPRKFLHYTLL